MLGDAVQQRSYLAIQVTRHASGDLRFETGNVATNAWGDGIAAPASAYECGEPAVWIGEHGVQRKHNRLFNVVAALGLECGQRAIGMR